MEFSSKEIEKTVKSIFQNKANGKVSSSKLNKQREIENLSNRLFDFIPSVCWMTESNLAKAMGSSKRQIKYAKNYLCMNDRITIKTERNGNRSNPVHCIYKKCDNPEVVNLSTPKSIIKWEIFNDFSPSDFSCMTIEEQLDLYEEMNLAFIPIHFPKFKGDLTYCSCSKGRNCQLIGKHPAIVFKELDFSKKSTYTAVKSQWERDNRFNIGFLTNNFAVIDVDFRHGGAFSLETLEGIYGEFPKSLTVKTGNGFHIYTISLMASHIKLLNYPGIDVRSKGGYVVAPSSQHHSGKFYEWQSLSVPRSLPDEFLRDVQKKPLKASVMAHDGKNSNDGLKNTFNSGCSILEGDRNGTLFRIASRKRGEGKEQYEILRFIERINSVNCEPPLSFDELRNIAESASHYTPNAHKELALKE